MGTIKVILKKDIHNLGEEGDVKIVKKGYARNYLFPKDLVFEFSKQNVNILESRKNKIVKRKEEKRTDSQQLKERLESEKMKFSIPSGDKGRLYGTVTNTNISEELNKLNYSIDKKDIELNEHIKFGGNYKYRIHLYQDIYAEMKLEVEAVQDKKKEQKTYKKSKDFKKHYDSDKSKEIETTVSETEPSKKEVETDEIKEDQTKDNQNSDVNQDQDSVENPEQTSQEELTEEK